MKEEYREFVGIYDESVPVELCNDFVNDYEKARKNRTFIDLSKINDLGFQDQTQKSIERKDEVAFIAPVLSSIYPIPPVQEYFKFLSECFKSYRIRYGIEFRGIIYNDVFKIHKVKKSEGYHKWHYEKDNPQSIDRLMAYMTYLVAPEKGGETEFLHQSLRIDPVVGRTLIWPAGFTHMHRGLPPLDGEKMYITGWFNVSKVNIREGEGI